MAGVFPAKRVSVRLSPNGFFNDMGTPEYRELSTHVIRQLDSAGIGFLHVTDGLGFGFHELGEPVTLQEVRPLFSGILIGNVGYTLKTAEQCIAAGYADMIAFGRPYIANPDLVERFSNGWPLAPEADMATWYSHGGRWVHRLAGLRCLDTWRCFSEGISVHCGSAVLGATWRESRRGAAPTDGELWSFCGEAEKRNDQRSPERMGIQTESPAARLQARVITVFHRLLCTLAEGFLGSTLRTDFAVGGAPPGLTPV